MSTSSASRSRMALAYSARLSRWKTAVLGRSARPVHAGSRAASRRPREGRPAGSPRHPGRLGAAPGTPPASSCPGADGRPAAWPRHEACGRPSPRSPRRGRRSTGPACRGSTRPRGVERRAARPRRRGRLRRARCGRPRSSGRAARARERHRHRLPQRPVEWESPAAGSQLPAAADWRREGPHRTAGSQGSKRPVRSGTSPERSEICAVIDAARPGCGASHPSCETTRVRGDSRGPERRRPDRAVDASSRSL